MAMPGDIVRPTQPAVVTHPASEELPPYGLAWWLRRLSDRLAARLERLLVYDRYYTGDQPLRFASEAFIKNFASRFTGVPGAEFASNLMALVVDTHRERLVVQGIRYGDDERDDRDAWRWWQAQRMDVGSALAFTESLVFGVSYVSVWPDASGEPVPTVEHPLETVVEAAPGRWWDRRAALKRWIDETGILRLELHLPAGNPGGLPAGVYRIRSKSAVTAWYWQWWPGVDVLTMDEPAFIRNRTGVVPIVPVPNRPRLARIVGGRLEHDDGESEISMVLSNQDAVNKYRMDALVASEFASFKQRWATGVDIPIDPETGQPVEPWRAGIDRIWLVPRPKADDVRAFDPKMGEFEAADLTPFMAAIDKEVKHIASISRTPYHYFLGEQQQNPPSGESLAASETGLVRKVESSQGEKGESIEEVVRLNFLWRGDPRGGRTDAEVIWRDAERRSESEHVDAITKLKAIGVPDEILQEMVPLSPGQLERIRAIQARTPAPQQLEAGVAEQLEAAGVPAERATTT